MSVSQHLPILPILVPLLTAAILASVSEFRRAFKINLSIASVLLQLVFAVALLLKVDATTEASTTLVYLLGNWAPPFGIALMVDRLAAMMLVLASVLALATLLFATARWDRVGVHFYGLFQLLLMGVNGAFLTHDLFNLFVFFEIMLAASYGLLLHGSGTMRVRAGLRYIAVNLVSSFIFLVGVGLIYAATGSLSMAEITLLTVDMPAADYALLRAGAAILAVAFLVKSAVWPLNFWLPTSYGVAVAPVAAMFAIMTKVGFYSLLRLWNIIVPEGALAGAQIEAYWVLGFAMMTLFFASLGMLAAQDLRRLAGVSIFASTGILLAGLSLGTTRAWAATLFYLLVSTLVVGALFLLIDLLERVRQFGADVLAVTIEAFEAQGMVLPEQEEVGVAIPAALAFLGLSFVVTAVLVTGLPPLAGFLAKFTVLVAVLNPAEGGVQWWHWLLMLLIIGSGLTGLIAFLRFGIRLFWVPESHAQPRLRVIEAGPVALLLALCVMLTLSAGPVMGYLTRTAESLEDAHANARAVLATKPVQREVLP
ncbi:MAG TPA: monovalent cation/H+ antiporter subunit D [Alcanivoracaceae bacterium]|nr:monovalent cation/H+ antiporter subunit D [Alcanivoracaceae bacterium]